MCIRDRLSCVLTAACAQIDAAVHNIPVQEYPHDDASGIKADLVKEPLKRIGGYLEIPTTPGIGIELNEEAFKHYPPIPYDRPPLINADGSALERVTFNDSFDGFPMFSPHGSQLGIASNRGARSEGETNVFIADWAED